MLSVQEQTRGSSVLLTGGLGFLGSVCLEQLLRLTEVRTVYLLVRGKRIVTASERVEKLLSGPLFHMLHKEAASGERNVFSKVRAVEGDLSMPGLGLSEHDRQLLVDEVDMVIHCAADLTLDAHIQATLRANYCGTRELLQLAREMSRLRSFVFTSTYWVNNFKPYNSPVKEEVHHVTLQLPGETRTLNHRELVDLLLSLPADEASKEAAGIMSRLNFTSTYAFGKLLTEHMLDDADCLPGVGKAIVRPSLITCVAGAPYPGYFTGFAGCPGYCLGYGVGFFHDEAGIAFSSDNILDIIPADTTAALVIAAAAAAAKGPLPCAQAQVFHACSASSHPRSSIFFMETLKSFWSANPPPFRLPLTRYPTITGRHVPTEYGLMLRRMITGAKVWVAAKMLEFSGNSRNARSLITSFKAFCVQNTIGYARSIVSRVDNALELRQSIVNEERGNWPCVWEQGISQDWPTYAFTALTAMRSLAFKLPADNVVTKVPHNFQVMKGLADPSVMQEWRRQGLVRSSSTSGSTGSCDLQTTVVLEAGMSNKKVD